MATILVVDDIPINRQFLVTLLGYSGHHLLEAADGLEGLAQVRALDPDLVIADLLMPTMDGFEFVRQLRADPMHVSTKVIFYTAAYSEAEVRTLARNCGVSHILLKPSAPEVVLQTVNTALGLATPPPPALVPEVFEREHLRLMTDKLGSCPILVKRGGLEVSQRLPVHRSARQTASLLKGNLLNFSRIDCHLHGITKSGQEPQIVAKSH